MNYYIYLIHNIKNNKVYVGKTDDINRRWREHCSIANSTNKSPKYLIGRAIAKYGVDNFVISTIQNFDSENVCLEAEKYWIKFFDSQNRDLGYNITEGGSGVGGWHPSIETRQKMSFAQTGKTRAFLHRENIGLARLGQKHDTNTIEKLSGENSIHAKLTQKIVDQIRELYTTENYSHRYLAKMFNVSKTQITNILNNKQWK